MLGSQAGSGGGGVFAFVLLCACGWFGLYCLGNLRDRSPAPVPPADTQPTPAAPPTARDLQDPVGPLEALVPAPELELDPGEPEEDPE